MLAILYAACTMDQQKITLADLFPELDENQLAEAEENLEAYLEAVWRIHERLQNEPRPPAEVDT